MIATRNSLLPHTDGVQRGALLVSACAACATPQFPPKAHCATCGDTAAPRWAAVTGTGSIWSFATFHKSYLPDFRLPTPYVVAVIALDEGVRLYGNIVGSPASALRIGMPVRAQFSRGDDGRTNLTFSLTDKGVR